MTVRAESWHRLLLSLAIEPGDPRVIEPLADDGAEGLWAKIDRGVGTLPAAWIAGARDAPARAEAAMSRAESIGARWVVPSSSQWPLALDDLDRVDGIGAVAGTPLGFWALGGGDLAELSGAPVAVVGARSCTTYGAESAGDIAADLADQGVTVVSGAAFGIDACAHRGALLGGGPTMAVLACGVDIEYPRPHAALLRRIAEEGLILSEYAPGQAVQRHRFLVRNRIIAGVSLGVVVVEAATRSGSLNTLNWADTLSRTTMAVPGPVTSQASSGAHRAVREGKAHLVTSGQDVLSDLFGVVAEPGMRISPAARRVWVRLDDQPRSVAVLAGGLRLGTSAVTRALDELAQLGVADRRGAGWARCPAGTNEEPAGRLA